VFISEQQQQQQQQQQQEKKKNYLRKTDLFALLLLPSNALCARVRACASVKVQTCVFFFFGIFLKIFSLKPKP